MPPSATSLSALLLPKSRLRSRHVLRESMKNRHREGAGLAGSCLGATEDIMSIEYDRYRLFLNGGWNGVALQFDGTKNGLCQIQIMECHGWINHRFRNNRASGALETGMVLGIRRALRQIDYRRREVSLSTTSSLQDK